MVTTGQDFSGIYHCNLEHCESQLESQVDLAYADILYGSPSHTELNSIIRTLRRGGALFVQTDQRSVAYVKHLLDHACNTATEGCEPYLDFVNWIIWPYDWGGRSKNAFGRKHDDILYYRRSGGEFVFNAEAVQVPKVALINSDKTTKTPTDVWSDIGNFHTMSRERIRDKDGHGVVWQKPEKLLERIIKVASNPGDLVFEPYLGTGTACAVAKRLGRRWVGCDTNAEMVALARQRLGLING